MSGAITFRPATRQDAVAILRLEEACMRGYAEALWGCWYPSQTAATLDLRGFEMIEAEGLFVGCVACEWHSDHLRVRKLYILPAFQGRGIGAMVLASKRRAAAARDMPIRLTVLNSNPDAKRFYEREGLSVAEVTEERTLLCSQ